MTTKDLWICGGTQLANNRRERIGPWNTWHTYSFVLLPGPVKGVSTLPKTNLAREPPIFTCYVSFREGSWLDDGRDQLLVDDGNDG